MADLTVEQFIQRLTDADIVEARQLENCWATLGTRDVTIEQFSKLLIQREMVTNFQLERLMNGKRVGYFYGKYKVLYIVGAGTFARVYRGVHRDNGTVRAIKVLRQRHSDDLKMTEVFLREGEMVKELKHPNIVPIYEIAQERNTYYMVMEFVEGQNLRDFVRVRGKLELLDALRIGHDLVAGLDYAFKRGVTHRDLKLSNVLLSSSGVGKLVDFGLAHADSDGDGGAGRSIDYAGLERCTSVAKNDKRSDIFFAGAMIYHMLSGKPAMLETRERMHRLSVSRFTDIKPLNEVAPDIPHRVAMIVNRAMEIKADKRYQTPGEMLSELRVIIDVLKEGGAEALESVPAPPPGVAAASAATGLPAVAEREGEGRTVMLVESNMKVQNALRDSLKKRGYRVLVISNPQRAIEFFDTDQDAADCVIFGLSELGDQALAAFSGFARSDFTNNIPCILLVEKSQRDFILKNAPLDATHVAVTMPFKMRQFREALASLIHKFHATKEV